ncbi:MAG: cation diffusion facilitator family transporter [Bacteroidia bacterium]|nr:cation diffusion facilitator family transporter [Bacteroidia bacterium]
MQWSLGGAILVLLLKAAAYITGGSAGFFSDAGESLINVLTALLGLYGVWWSRQPRDREHPYGHGKIDSLIAAIQAIIVVVTAGILAFSILGGKYAPAQVDNLPEVVLYQGGAIGINSTLAFFLWYASRKHRLTILRAESYHLLSDVATSLVVLLNFFALKWGLPASVDRLVGLGVVLVVGYGALRILRDTGAALVDAQDPRLLNRLTELIKAHHRPEWIDIHNVRIQRYGQALHVDGHITLPWYWSLREAHEAMKALEDVLRKELQVEVEFFWHMDPCEPVCCPFCELRACPHRKAPFKKKTSLTPEKLFINQKAWEPGLPHQSMKGDISQPPYESK